MKVVPYLTQAIGNVLSDYRWARKFTKTALAEASGLQLHYVFEIERGSRNPSVGAIFLLLRALDVRPAEYFQRVEEECLRLMAQNEPEPEDDAPASEADGEVPAPQATGGLGCSS